MVKAQYYYMDQFVLSASANKLFVHQINLPEVADDIGEMDVIE